MKFNLNEHINLFVESLQGSYSPYTIQSYTNDIRQYQKFLLGQIEGESLSLNDLDRMSVRRYTVSLYHQGKRPGTIHRKIASLSSFFEFLRRHNVIDKNPVRGITRPKLLQTKPTYIQEKELGKLLDNLPADTPVQKRDRAMMELFYGCGLRLSELLALTINDFEGGNYIHIIGKGDKERFVPLGKRALSALADYLQARNNILSGVQSEWLFVNSKGNRLDRRFVQRKVKQLLSSISAQLSPHSLRHAFATHMMRKGADLRVIQELLGHENLTATQIYTHYCPQDLQEVFEKTHPRA